jgi:hypothetical protein
MWLEMEGVSRVYMCVVFALGGVFKQRAHSANYHSVCPRNTPENHPPTEACMVDSKL